MNLKNKTLRHFDKLSVDPERSRMGRQAQGFMLSLSKHNSGLTLMESLIAIMLLCIIAVSILGSFYISRLSSSRAEHRLTAMNILREHIETEVAAGYDGGNDGEADYYVTVTSPDPIAVVVDDVTFTVTPDPYYPDNVEGLIYGTVPYKIVGFVVTWNEGIFGQVCSERLVAYVSYHSSS